VVALGVVGAAVLLSAKGPAPPAVAPTRPAAEAPAPSGPTGTPATGSKLAGAWMSETGVVVPVRFRIQGASVSDSTF